MIRRPQHPRLAAGLALVLSLAGGAASLVATPGASAAEAAQAAAIQSEGQRLAAFFESVFRRNLRDSPMFQSYIGMKGPDYGRWDDGSEAELKRQDTLNRQDLARLRQDFDYAALAPQSQLSYRIFEFLREQAITDFPWRRHTYVFSSNGNPASELVTFLQNVHRIDDASDAEAYVNRIRGIEGALAQSVEDARAAAAAGIVPTAYSFAPVLADARRQLQGAPLESGAAEHPLLADFRNKVEALQLPTEQKQRLIAAAAEAISGPFRRGVERFVACVEELRPRSGGANGAWSLPRGDAYYRAKIAQWTTDPALDADTLHALGLAEVARIRGEMEAIVRRVGFAGDLEAFFAYLRTSPDNFFPDTDDGKQAYLDQSKAYIDAIYKDVHRYFNVLPKAPLEVRRVEAWREATAPLAFYEQPTPDGSRPGIYYVNLRDMKSSQKHEMETVAYHEGAPGHHFQIAIQQELTGVPEFQKFAFFGAYVEGWGLYAERLAKEQGRFTDPLQDFGRLQNEMLRAVRLVVDTGGHAKRWTREQMIDYMLANNPMSHDDAVKEVERYLDDPGQALSYKVGMLRILDLRERARTALGERFDLRAFHDVVLKSGALPLPILEKQVKAYTEATRGAR
jgi:uncharacterized protein (DUF885 family)